MAKPRTLSVALVSAIYGAYDHPKPLPADFAAPAYLYTDDPALDAPGWEVRYAPLSQIETPMMQAKWWKTHPVEAAPEADVSLWLDGSMTITVPDYVGRCLDALGRDDMVLVTHPTRDCIYTEAAYSATLPRYAGARLAEQAAAYWQQGHPEHWGLFASGANVRRHVPAVTEHGALWWEENVVWSWQDQVSLPVVTRESAVRWNVNMPWHQWWHKTEHAGLMPNAYGT